jgi:hypothetical protein
MADKNPRGRAPHDLPSPAGDDRKTETAVLALLLDEHPTRLTLGELILALGDDNGDAGRRAVSALVGAGLAHRDGDFLTPTRAALYFQRLEVN